MESKFATCLNCIDGRVQLPVINWITKNYEFEYVDMITEAGIDGLLAENSYNPANLLHKLAISLGQHHSSKIFIVGHYDCAANPVDEAKHKKQIKKAVKRIKNYTLACDVIGIWVNKYFQIKIICTTGGLNQDDTPVYEYSTS